MSAVEEHKRDAGARTKAATAGSVSSKGKIGGELKFHKKSPFLTDRVAIWDEMY